MSRYFHEHLRDKAAACAMRADISPDQRGEWLRRSREWESLAVEIERQWHGEAEVAPLVPVPPRKGF